MTIFDTIRYPISDIPTVEQLEALPSTLFRRWAKRANFEREASILGIVFWFECEYVNRELWNTYPSAKEDIQLLRDMIRRKR